MIQSQRRASSSTTSGTRVKLLDAAAAIIATDGAAAATSRAIVDGAGENLGAITYYFGSKQNLMAEVHARAAHDLIQPVLTTLRSGRPPLERLLEAVQQLNKILQDNRSRLVGYTQTIAPATHDPAVGDSLRALYKELREALADDISDQKQTSLVPDWVEPNAMADLIVAVANGIAIAAATDPEQTNPAATSAQFAQLLLAARPD